MPQVLRDAEGVERGGAARSEQPTHYRTIWLSDIHLGTRGCKADFLLDFLRTHRVPTRSTSSATSSTAGG